MDYSGKKVLVMGLGLHGGGLETARFLLKRGADVTVTDLRDEATLKPSIEKLDTICRELGYPSARYVIGMHETDDFKNADIIVKNPGVRPDSPFLQAAKKIETDISLFLSENPARLFAVTGTKGKSSTASALHWILREKNCPRINTNCHELRKVYLGGNITVSPLTFVDDLTADDDVVLELSSFQLGDLKGRVKEDGSPLLKPAAAILTPIMADHLDRYATMDEYIDDKRNIYRGQDASCVTIAGDDNWGKSFLKQTKAKPLVYSRNAPPEGVSGGWLENTKAAARGCARLYGFDGIPCETVELVPGFLPTPGEHQKINSLAAALAAFSAAMVNPDVIRQALSTFKGVEHRLEFFHETEGVRFFNDSAATIPEAAAACVEALKETPASQTRLVLVTGGTDKNLDFTPLVKAIKRDTANPAAVVLLAGSGGEKLSSLLADNGISFSGPFDNLDNAVRAALECAANLACKTSHKKSGKVSVALSPGCASFGMFLNEFDRGRRWKEAVLRLA